MVAFRFIHAADLHIDSPLVGLTASSPSFAERVENASRQAFDNLISPGDGSQFDPITLLYHALLKCQPSAAAGS